MSEADGSALDGFLEPLRLAIESEYARKRLFGEIGWDVEALPQARVVAALETIEAASTTLAGFADDPPDTLEEFGDALAAAERLVDGFLALDDAVGDTAGASPEIYAALGEDLLTHLAVLYFRSEHPVLLQVGVFLTLVRSADPTTRPTLTLDDGTTVRYSSPALDFDLEHVVDLMTDPVETLKAEYGLDESPDRDELQRSLSELLLPVLAALLYAAGAEVSYSTENDQVTSPFPGLGEQLGWIRVGYGVEPADFHVRVHVYADADGNVALAVVPGGEAVVNHRLGGWAFTLTTAGTSSALAIDTTDGSVAFETGSTERLDVTLRAVKLPEDDSENAFVGGGTEGTRLEIGRLGVEGRARIAADQEYGLLARASDSTFVLSANDADGFISQVFPEETAADFDLGLGWSTVRGVHLEGSGSLDMRLPMHLSLGELLSLEELSVSVSPDATTGRIPVYVTTTASVQLGPVSAVVERIGLKAELGFPDGGGDRGPVDVDLGFKPPNGAGLSVDAAAVTGGGYLFFDPDRGQYAGTLQLQFGNLTLSAVGILTTRMPDGSEGFSLLLIITGEFPPIQLGFGFTLNSVGGLLGVNRTVALDPLRSGIRAGRLDSVLFPRDPVRNAPQIISDLGTFFPPAPGRFIVGPMVKLGWGTPTLMTADLGVALELPAPVRLVVMGRLRTILPAEEAELIRLQMDALGVIDFDRGDVSVDATLFDSRFVQFTASGDMALRANWGADPDFALSAGGFNPRFQPPENFPALRRLTISLATGDNPRLRLETYLAVTSNTFQVGAKLELYAAAAGFSIEGVLGFDALFRFSPFSFVADLVAGVAVKRGSRSLFSIRLELTLSGPKPWHARGKAKFKLLFISVSIPVNLRIGSDDQPPLPEGDPLGELRAALSDPRNWSGQVPAGGRTLVSLRERPDRAAEDDTDRPVLVHPLSPLTVRQHVVPLGVEIQKFGNTRPRAERLFEITGARIRGESVRTTPVTEKFAPANFFEYTDEEKLTRPSFEDLAAGVTVGTPGVSRGEGVTTTLDYETEVIDERRDPDAGAKLDYTLPFDRFVALDGLTAVAESPMRTTGRLAFAAPAVTISIRETQYAVATTDSLAVRADLAAATSYAVARTAFGRALLADPAAAHGVQVVSEHAVTVEEP